MKRKKLVICSIFVIFMLSIGFFGYRYHIYQKTELIVYAMYKTNPEVVLHGKESLAFQNIFLNGITYFEEEEFSAEQEDCDWAVKYIPRTFQEYALHRVVDIEYEDFLLNFNFYEDKDNKRIVVLGSVHGAPYRWGYIQGEDYEYLKNLMNNKLKKQGYSLDL